MSKKINKLTKKQLERAEFWIAIFLALACEAMKQNSQHPKDQNHE